MLNRDFSLCSVAGGAKQSTVQRSALLKLPCNALFISLILPDRRQIYSFCCLAVIESLSPRVSKISSLQRCCLKPLPVFGLQEDREASRIGPLEITQCSPCPPFPRDGENTSPSHMSGTSPGHQFLPGVFPIFSFTVWIFFVE